MLDWSFIRQCHAHVPVLYWPVLWVSLARLAATIAVYREEGRRFGCVRVTHTGHIWFDFLDESDAERERRGALAPGFDRTPWARLTLSDEIAPGLGAGEPVNPAGAQLAWNYTATSPEIHPLWPPWAGALRLWFLLPLVRGIQRPLVLLPPLIPAKAGISSSSIPLQLPETTAPHGERNRTTPGRAGRATAFSDRPTESLSASA